MILLILISLFVILLVGLLTAPFYIFINTDKGLYHTGLARIFEIHFQPDSEKILIIFVRILFLKSTFYPFLKSNDKEQDWDVKTLKKAKKKFVRRSKIRMWFTIISTFIKRSKIKKLQLNIDTHDVQVNALLFPIFAVINRGQVIQLDVNYSGNFSLIMDIRYNLYSALIGIFKYFYKKHFT